MKAVNQQVILLTGATDGIGRIAALRLAEMGATVLLHGRDPDKCRAIRDDIREAGGKPRTEYFTADFSSLLEVGQMAAAICEWTDHLDVLINNAGVLPVDSKSGKGRLSAEGTICAWRSTIGRRVC